MKRFNAKKLANTEALFEKLYYLTKNKATVRPELRESDVYPRKRLSTKTVNNFVDKYLMLI